MVTSLSTPAPSAAEQGRIAAEAINKFSAFVRVFWHVVDPNPFMHDWYIDVICDAVQRQVDGDPAYRWLLVCQPPGTAKSRLMSVMRPAWTWLRMPHRRMFYVSTSEDVAMRDSRFTRLIIKSPEYAMLRGAVAADAKRRLKDDPAFFGKMARGWDFAKDQDEKGNFENTLMGARFCSTIGAKNTGHRGADLVVDDPVNVRDWEKASPRRREEMFDEAWADCQYILETRNDSEQATRTLVMQRVGVGDPAGRAMEQGQWKVINVPAQWWANNPHAHPSDPRRVEGQRLARYGEAELARKRQNLGAASFEAQFNQRPRVVSGGLIDKSLTDALPRFHGVPELDEVTLFVDCTFKGRETSDRVSIQAWGRRGTAAFYLLARDTRRMGYNETKRAVKAMKGRFPTCRCVVVEDKANGPAVIEDLGKEIPGVVAYNPGTRGKWERAKVALLPAVEARNIHVPADEPWVDDVLAEWVAFRGKDGDEDDDVDTASMAMARMGLGGVTPWVEVAGRAVATVVPSGGGELYRWGAPTPSSRHVAGYYRGCCVVLDAAGEQVAAVDGGVAASLLSFAGLRVGVVVEGEADRTALRVLRADGLAASEAEADTDRLREALVHGRCRCRDGRLHDEWSAGDGDGDWTRALAAAWSLGVRLGVYAEPGKPRRVPSAREERMERWGIDAGGAPPESPWAAAGRRLRAG